MRSIATAIWLSFLFTASAVAQTPATAAATPTGDQQLQRAKDTYHSGHYTEAVADLRAASAAFLSPEEKQRYIETGKLDTLPQIEQSLVYLALAYGKLGKDAEARDAIMRLANADRIAPTFATLSFDGDAADFRTLVTRVAPAVTLPANAQQRITIEKSPAAEPR